jgi:membrane-associated phospholipid phosphatase
LADDQTASGATSGSVSRLATVAAVLVGVLALLAGLELGTPVLTGADGAVLSWMLAHRTASLTTVAVAVTNSGASPLLFPLVAAAGFAVGFRTRRWSPGVAAVGVAAGGVLSRLGLSDLIRDARPPRTVWLVEVNGFSFPSGHAATSALVAGTLAWLLTFLIRARSARVAITAVLAVWALLVALSRMYLGVHWVSDILGSWLLAGAWLTALLATQGGWTLAAAAPRAGRARRWPRPSRFRWRPAAAGTREQ